jgi:hypothetical protein
LESVAKVQVLGNDIFNSSNFDITLGSTETIISLDNAPLTLFGDSMENIEIVQTNEEPKITKPVTCLTDPKENVISSLQTTQQTTDPSKYSKLKVLI